MSSEFNLSEERERLRKVMICSLVESKILNFGKAEAIFDKFFETIKIQDKEFIKRLKEELFGGVSGLSDNEAIDKIDELAGDDLK